MKCQKAAELIYQNRPGELSSRQQRRLQIHLEGCLQCAEEFRNALRAGEVVSSLRSVRPVPEDPQPMMNRVLNMISQREPSAIQTPIKKRTQLSWAFIGAAAMLLFTFILQEITVFERISRLESQMAMQTKLGNTEAPVQHVSLAGLQSWIQEQPLRSPLTRFDVPEGRITIDENEYRQLVHEIRQTRLMNKMLLELLGDDSTALQQVRFEDGLNPTELRQLGRIEKRLLKTGRLPVEVKR